MAFTFSTESFTRPIAEFGNDAAQMILQTGATIQDGLQKMMTNRQVASLGQELGTINPESPEWSQKAVQLGSRYPLAMKSPQGQFMLSTQAKAHAEWAQAQRATQQADVMMKRQMGMENLRTQNDMRLKQTRSADSLARQDGGVDLLPGARPVPSNPAQGIELQGPTQSGEPLGAAPQDEPGMSGLLPDISERALGPLRKAQEATISPELPRGVKPTPAQIFSRVEHEDRQMQQEKRDVERTAKAEADALARKEETLRKEARTLAVQKENAARTTKRSLLMQKRKEVGTAVSKARTALNKHIDPEQERRANDDEYFAKKATLEAELQRAGQEAEALDKEITSIVDAVEGEEEKVYRTEKEALAAGKEVGDTVMLINPRTGKPAKARLE